MNKEIELKANLGIVVRGDILELKDFLVTLDDYLSEFTGISLIHKQLSASRLWIKEGDEMNGTGCK
jgi:hypothetical protein